MLHSGVATGVTTVMAHHGPPPYCAAQNHAEVSVHCSSPPWMRSQTLTGARRRARPRSSATAPRARRPSAAAARPGSRCRGSSPRRMQLARGPRAPGARSARARPSVKRAMAPGKASREALFESRQRQLGQRPVAEVGRPLDGDEATGSPRLDRTRVRARARELTPPEEALPRPAGRRRRRFERSCAALEVMKMCGTMASASAPQPDRFVRPRGPVDAAGLREEQRGVAHDVRERARAAQPLPRSARCGAASARSGKTAAPRCSCRPTACRCRRTARRPAPWCRRARSTRRRPLASMAGEASSSALACAMSSAQRIPEIELQRRDDRQREQQQHDERRRRARGRACTTNTPSGEHRDRRRRRDPAAPALATAAATASAALATSAERGGTCNSARSRASSTSAVAARGRPTARRSRRPSGAPCRTSAARAQRRTRPAAAITARAAARAATSAIRRSRRRVGIRNQHSDTSATARAADPCVQFTGHGVTSWRDGGAATTPGRRRASVIDRNSGSGVLGTSPTASSLTPSGSGCGCSTLVCCAVRIADDLVDRDERRVVGQQPVLQPERR